MASSSAPHSSFATILRRSKFASYDPTIGQVYTATTAQRARGNFGFKRQFPTQTSKAKKYRYVTVSAAETPWNVMFWESGERSARWMKIMDTVQPPLMRPLSFANSARAGWDAWLEGTRPNDKNTWYDESEFTRLLERDGGARSLEPTHKPSINWRRIDKKAFAKYVETLRGVREEFKDWIMLQRRKSELEMEAYERDAAASGKPNQNWKKKAQEAAKMYGEGAHVDVFMLMQQPGADALIFEFLRDRVSRDWREQLIPAPHPTAGFSYPRPSRLQSFLNTKPVEGVVVGGNDYLENGHQRKNTQKQFLVDVGGHVARTDSDPSGSAAHRSDAGGGAAGKIGQRLADDEDGNKGLFRIWKGTLIRPPRTAGKLGSDPPYDDVTAARVNLDVAEVTGSELLRENPHRPGSGAYIAQPPRVAKPQQTVLSPTSGVGKLMSASSANAANSAVQGGLMQTLADLLDTSTKQQPK